MKKIIKCLLVLVMLIIAYRITVDIDAHSYGILVKDILLGLFTSVSFNLVDKVE